MTAITLNLFCFRTFKTTTAIALLAIGMVSCDLPDLLAERSKIIPWGYLFAIQIYGNRTQTCGIGKIIYNIVKYIVGVSHFFTWQ